MAPGVLSLTTSTAPSADNRFQSCRNFFRVEPGINAGRVTFGYWRGTSAGFYSSHVGLMRTWNPVQDIPAGVTYYGFEQRVTLAAFEAGIGIYLRASGYGLGAAPYATTAAPPLVISVVLGANFMH